jgi:hypothetical protein
MLLFPTPLLRLFSENRAQAGPSRASTLILYILSAQLGFVNSFSEVFGLFLRLLRKIWRSEAILSSCQGMPAGANDGGSE